VDDVKHFILHSSDPLHMVVETYQDAIVHFVIEIAQLLQASKDVLPFSTWTSVQPSGNMVI
jgi:hypothetical protein